MGEQIKSITQNTLVPIGLLIAVIGAVFYLGSLSNQINQNTKGVTECKGWQAQAPTQYQFQTLQASIEELKVEIKDLKKGIDEIKK